MSYFQHGNLSNSDIKDFIKKNGGGFEEPENLQAIYAMGSLNHAVIFEPHETKGLMNQHTSLSHQELELALQMKKTFWADQMCREFAMANDFEREKPFYNDDVKVGPYMVRLRCKTDGVRTRMKVYLEFKGLAVETEKQFRDALIRYEYDQACVHYMLTGDFKMALIVGISKKDPSKLFKWLVKKHDEFYLGGEQRLIDDLTLLRNFSPEDVTIALCAKTSKSN